MYVQIKIMHKYDAEVWVNIWFAVQLLSNDKQKI